MRSELPVYTSVLIVDLPRAGYVARYLGIAATCEGLIDSGSILALKEVRHTR